MKQLPGAGRRAGLAIAAVASVVVAGLATGPSYAGGAGAGLGSSARASVGGSSARAPYDPHVDVSARAARVATWPGDLRGLSRQAVSQTAARDGLVLDLDGATGTVRFLANLGGYLTPRSGRGPERIVRDYVRANAAALGLTRADLATLHLRRDYRDIAGIHHLFFTQRVGGEVLARNGLTASVTRGGHLLTLGGSPVAGAGRAKLPAVSTWTVTSGRQALALTRGPAGAGAGRGEDTASRVLIATPGGLRPAWETIETSSATPATTVVDAVTGRVLLRTPLRHYEHSTGRAFRSFPGADRGGRQVTVDFTKKGWLGPEARVLSGVNAHVFSDVDDDNRPSRSEEVRARRGQTWDYRLQPFRLGYAASFCSNPWPCSWNPNRPYSWRVNRAQNATQVFFYVNNWHDHLQRRPIGFTEAAGNFQVRNTTGHGRGGDPLMAQTDDGANTGRGRLRGLPDEDHVDNANMVTPPDGHSPQMQMYLQHRPFTSYPKGDPWSPTNAGDEADTVYHEYTHGLSGRLVVDVRGREAIGPVQGDAMGEAWSDWYAIDYLVAQGLAPDRPGRADVQLSIYDGAGVALDRTEAMDCKVGRPARLCGGGHTGHGGGYTYADFGHVVSEPEVHADGEIWGQTLWDLRDRLGSWTTRGLVTRAMELAPTNPSFLDMRNAVLVADQALHHGRHHGAIWQVFAGRGMGFYAGSLGQQDTTPAASFAVPPVRAASGSIEGVVRDAESGRPLAGLTVSLAFQGLGAVNPTAVTDADGHYAIAPVPQATYGKLALSGRGYRAVRSVTVGEGTTTADLAARPAAAGR